MRDLGYLEVERKAKVALKRGKPVTSWAERATYKMGTPLDKLYSSDK